MSDTEDPISLILPTGSTENNDSNTKAKIIILGNLLGLVFYVFDMSTDAYTADQHYTNNHFEWFILTLASIIIPIVIASIGAIFIVIQTDKCSGLVKILLVIALIFCTPIVPLSILVWKFVGSIRRYPDNDVADDEDIDDATICASGVKFLLSVTESFPQATIQMYIVFQFLSNDGTGPDYLWLTITASLIALAYSIPSNEAVIIINDLPIKSKAGMFVFILLISVSRILVSSIYSSIHIGLLFVPVGAELVAYCILGWIHCCCSRFECKGFWEFMIAMVSFSNLCFAIGGFFLPVSPFILPFTIAAIIIAAVCWIAICISICLSFQRKISSS